MESYHFCLYLCKLVLLNISIFTLSLLRTHFGTPQSPACINEYGVEP